MKRPDTPAPIDWIGLDAGARDGRYHLVTDGEEIALAKWAGDRFVFSSGAPLSYVPGYYQRPRGLQA